MGFVGHATNVMALYKNILSFSVARQARWVSFKIFSKAVAIKCGGDANVGYAWHVLLCKVILGNVEAVPAGSKQSQPSSKQYDTGG
ncbi:hypothetical protein JHK87_013083 [Glycine soja]|nr:hypothetical protein JHK87_013083 [Glycine soja]